MRAKKKLSETEIVGLLTGVKDKTYTKVALAIESDIDMIVTRSKVLRLLPLPKEVVIHMLAGALIGFSKGLRER